MTSPTSPAKPQSAASGRVAALLAQGRRADLVWRSAEASRPVSEATSRAATATLAADMGQAPTSASSSPRSPVRNHQEQVVVRANALDPALVNRLADDVIRRIDRRARIERERRGII